MALTDKLTAVADAIRGKTGKAEPLTLDQMATEITGIQAGGNDDVTRSILDRTITEYADDQITTLGQSAFYGCTTLDNVNLPACTTISGIAVFRSCTALKNALLPKLSSINGGNNYNSGHAFADCKALESIDFPLLTDCHFGAFTGCTALKNVNLPVLKTKSQNVLSNCTSLEKICLPEMEHINTSFANGCTSLKIVDLPKANYFYQNCFDRCSSIVAIILRNEAKVAQLAFANVFNKSSIASGVGYIYVPAALIEDYKAATNWSTYATQFRALEEYTIDGTVAGELDESKI